MNRSIATSDLRKDISIDSTLPRPNGGIRDFVKILLRTPSICRSKHKQNKTHQKRFAVITDKITEDLRTEIIDDDDDLPKLNTPKAQATSCRENLLSPIIGEVDADKVSLIGSSSIFHSTFNYPLHSTLLFDEDFPDVVCSSPPIWKNSASQNSDEKQNIFMCHDKSKVISDSHKEPKVNFLPKNFKTFINYSSPTSRNSLSSTKEHYSVHGDRLSRQSGYKRRTKRINKDFYRFIGQYLESNSYCFNHRNEFNCSVQCLEL